MKILAIPFAGGNRYSYEIFKKSLPSFVEWITLELPGRGGRLGEPLMSSVADVVKDLYDQLSTYIKRSDEKYIIYGHSLGALLAYEIGLRIEASDLPNPRHIFLSGRAAPMIPLRVDWTQLPPEEFWKKVATDGGLPEGFLESQELKDYYYPILVSDFRLLSHYVYSPPINKVCTPVTIWIGSEEINDSKEGFKLNEIEAWQEVCDLVVSIDYFEGNHFFIFKHMVELNKIMLRPIN